MTTEHILDKTTWESLVRSFSEANFLQSWQWGVFQENLGKQVIRILISQNGKNALAQLVVESAKRGKYAAVAGGPLLDWQDVDLVQAVFEVLTATAKDENCVFMRFRPQELETNISKDVLATINAHPAPMHLTADLTLQLDITQSDEAILTQMRKNTRYEVKKAEKLGIETRITVDPGEVKSFYEQQMIVAQRHKFVPFSERFLTAQFNAFTQDDQVALVHAYQGTQLLATAFIIFYNGEAVYHYGISTEENAHLPGSYAAQWAAIQEAKARGCSRYNFWGIAPEGKNSHRFAGVSLFKRGFGGVEVSYLPAQDIPLSQLYWITWVFEFLRKKMRKL